MYLRGGIPRLISHNLPVGLVTNLCDNYLTDGQNNQLIWEPATLREHLSEHRPSRASGEHHHPKPQHGEVYRGNDRERAGSGLSER